MSWTGSSPTPAGTATSTNSPSTAPSWPRRRAAGIPPASIPCHLVAVEKSEPFRCGVWLVTPALLDDLDLQNLAALDEFASCEQTGAWPTRYEERRTFHAV